MIVWEDRYPNEREPVEESPPFDHHDHRDTGDPMEKRDIGSASDWEHGQQREHIPGLSRRY